MIKNITIIAGNDKSKNKENFDKINLYVGNMYAIIGNTGSGKSRLIKDIEQLVNKDSVTKRKILINDKLIKDEDRYDFSSNMIAHLSQNMRFVLDSSVEEFINLHNKCRNKNIPFNEVINLANTIASEPIHKNQNLNLLSGGQTRALMIADIALICDSPIVLIDEIENAGINKITALKTLYNTNKLILLVTHDTQIALMAKSRIIMQNGSIKKVVNKTIDEEKLLKKLEKQYKKNLIIQEKLRNGDLL